MIKALRLIFSPASTWQGISDGPLAPTRILAWHTLPLLLLVGIIEGYGLVHWGEPRGAFGRLKMFPVSEAIVFEAVQFLLSLIIVFIGASMLKTLGGTFHARHTYGQAFAAVAYGLSPLFTLRILDASPFISPYAAWFIGITLSVAILYHGIPILMEPDPPHAFGLFLLTSLLLVVSTGLVRFLTASYLKGKFPNLESAVSSLTQQLPF